MESLRGNGKGVSIVANMSIKSGDKQFDVYIDSEREDRWDIEEKSAPRRGRKQKEEGEE